MKAILLILLIVVGSYAAYLQYTRPVVEAPPTAQVDPGLVAALADAKVEIKELKAQLSASREELAEHLAEVPEPIQAPVASEAPTTPAPVTPAPAPANNVEERLAAMEKIYLDHKAKFDEQLAKLQSNEEVAAKQLQALYANPPQFGEQTRRWDSKKEEYYNAGVRTSEADRKKVLGLHQAQLDQMQAYLTSIEKARADIEAQIRDLEQKYSAARAGVTSETAGR